MADVLRESGASATVCEHLRPVLEWLLTEGAKVTFAGQAWSHNCRTWVYVDRVVDPATIRARMPLPAVVSDHVHRGTHEGSEQGLVCNEHHDAVMGPLPRE